MATFIAIKNAKQSRGSMAGAMGYVAQDEKTLWKGISLVAGHNCVPQSSYIEFLTTKKRFHKMEGRQFYHFVQSFAEGDRLTPQLANAIGVELAEKEFPDFEVLVATHIDTGHLHNHLIVNSVSCVDGKKLHQNSQDLQHHRDVNDQICMKYHLSVLQNRRSVVAKSAWSQENIRRDFAERAGSWSWFSCSTRPCTKRRTRRVLSTTWSGRATK